MAPANAQDVQESSPPNGSPSDGLPCKWCQLVAVEFEEAGDASLGVVVVVVSLCPSIHRYDVPINITNGVSSLDHEWPSFLLEVPEMDHGHTSVLRCLRNTGPSS